MARAVGPGQHRNIVGVGGRREIGAGDGRSADAQDRRQLPVDTVVAYRLDRIHRVGFGQGVHGQRVHLWIPRGHGQHVTEIGSGAAGIHRVALKGQGREQSGEFRARSVRQGGYSDATGLQTVEHYETRARLGGDHADTRIGMGG
ncbi:hypothetical protein ACPESR_12920 [Nocardia testacea]|uniref:hypothetical protein n=1 Tax=Nocardia testacea TaxID=248551 RepID=UPI003C2F2EFF